MFEKRVWGRWMVVLCGLFAFLPLGALFHVCSIEWGSRVYDLHWAAHLFRNLIFTLLLAVFAGTWPVAYLLFHELEEKRAIGFPGFLFFSLICLAPPFVSFCCFLAPIKDLMDSFEVFLVVFPAIICAIGIFWETRKPWIFTLVLTVLLFIPLFVVSDILSPFSTLVSFASRSARFYWIRSLLPMSFLGLGLLLMPHRVRALSLWRRDAAFSVAGLLGFILGLRFLLPIAISRTTGESLFAYIQWDVSWIAFIALFVFFSSPSRTTYLLALSGTTFGAASSLYFLVRETLFTDTNFWHLTSGAQELFASFILAQLILEMWRPARRDLFLTLKTRRDSIPQ